MSLFCNSCRLVFKGEPQVCPECGGHVDADNLTIEQKIEQDYRFYRCSVKTGGSRKDYYTDLLEKGQQVSTVEPAATVTRNPEGTVSVSEHKPGSLGGYFGQNYSSQETIPVNLPASETVSSAASPTLPVPSVSPDFRPTVSEQTLAALQQEQNAAEQRMRAAEEEQHKFEREQRRLERRRRFQNFVNNINIRTVFRLLLFVIIISIAAAIWINRQSIISFLIGTILPIVVIALIIIYCFRGRGRRYW